MHSTKRILRLFGTLIPCFVAVAGAVVPARADAQGASVAPTDAQISLVEERRASFPGTRLVESVDWYRPLVSVPGGNDTLREGHRLSPEASHRLDGFAAQTDSFALLVARNGQVIHEYYAPGIDRTTRFDTASMHKAVVALLVGAAVADGAIKSIDDPLDRYLTGLPDDGRGRITIRQLLEMRSGLRTPPLSESAASPYWQTYFGEDLAWSISQWPMQPATADQFYYANANTQYLLWVIESATGQSYRDYLSRRLWQPIGAQDARLWLDHEGGSPRGFCCLQASGQDWLRIGELIRNHGRWGTHRLIPARWVTAMMASSAANPNFGRNLWRGSPYAPARTYGPGIPAVIRSGQPFVRDDTVFIDGSGGQRVYVIPSERLTIVRIGRPRADWDDSQLPNLVVGLVQ